MTVALAAGTMGMALTASCDPRSGSLFVDRYDDDDIYFYDDCGFLGWIFGCDDGFYVEEEIFVIEEYY